MLRVIRCRLQIRHPIPRLIILRLQSPRLLKAYYACDMHAWTDWVNKKLVKQELGREPYFKEARDLCKREFTKSRCCPTLTCPEAYRLSASGTRDRAPAASAVTIAVKAPRASASKIRPQYGARLVLLFLDLGLHRTDHPESPAPLTPPPRPPAAHQSKKTPSSSEESPGSCDRSKTAQVLTHVVGPMHR
jgi:hypothetical protein